MKHILSIIGYIIGTFAVQATSHFAVFKAHYDAMPFTRPDPIFAFGIAIMIIQGAVLSFIYANSQFNNGKMVGALILSWLIGAVLVSYEALAEVAKYNIPDIAAWVGIETLTGAIQFTLIGLLLYYAHRFATRGQS